MDTDANLLSFDFDAMTFDAVPSKPAPARNYREEAFNRQAAAYAAQCESRREEVVSVGIDLAREAATARKRVVLWSGSAGERAAIYYRNPGAKRWSRWCGQVVIGSTDEREHLRALYRRHPRAYYAMTVACPGVSDDPHQSEVRS